MNYSQRKHIHRLMAGIPPMFDDPLSLNVLGVRVQVSPDIPRYTLPAEVIPGVPWPPGFRDDINRWSHDFLGTTNLVPLGSTFMLGNGVAVMRREDVVKLQMIA